MNSFLLNPFANYLATFLKSETSEFLMILVSNIFYFLFITTPLTFLILYSEKKLLADVEIRLGPNRIKPAGIFFPIAEFIKSLGKGNFNIRKIGILFSFQLLFLIFSTILVAQDWTVSSPQNGLIEILVFIVFAELFWFMTAFHTKRSWSFISSLDFLVNAFSFLPALAIGFLSPMLISGSANLDKIVFNQSLYPWKWNFIHDPGAPLSALSVFFSMLIWMKNKPFDLPFSSSENETGILYENSGTLFFLQEFYRAFLMLICSSLLVTLFFGGWQSPFQLESFGRAANLVFFLFFVIKISFFVIIFIWIESSFPRLNQTQIGRFTWKVTFPLAVLGLCLSSIWMYAFKGKGFFDF